MKTKDLRICNQVKCKISNDNAVYEIVAIDGINAKVMLSGARMGEWIPIEKIKPIPLTEEKLLELGFNNTSYKKGYIGIDVNYTDFILTYPLAMGEFQKHFAFQYETGIVHKFKELPYLHDLQNLFYLSTGNDLIVEL